MGLRLFRRIKIAPGISINLSKSGLSASAGVRGAWKITKAALDELEKTTPWKKFARGYGEVRGRPVRPADIYGPKGMLDGWGTSFKTPGDLWEVLARNMGGGMPPEVPKTLMNLCGPRVESL